jgi:hypothetical protein
MGQLVPLLRELEIGRTLFKEEIDAGSKPGYRFGAAVHVESS